MVILHVLAPAQTGGLERVVQTLALGLAEQGHEVHLAVIVEPAERESHTFVRALANSAVQLHPITVGNRAYLKERAALRELCRQLQPKVVHTHGYRPDVLAAPLARALRIPTATTVHGFTAGDWRNRLYEALQRRSFRSFDAVVAVSRPLSERLARTGLSPARLRMIQNAWPGSNGLLSRADARKRLGIDSDAFQVGWVGRLSREKGADVLLDALPHLNDESVQLNLMGDGPEGPRLYSQAAQLNSVSTVRWLGNQPAADTLYQAFDAFVLSSRTEGTPMALFEAMAARLPIIATRVGGVPDVVDETCALLVPSEDPAALASALRAIRAEPAAAARRAENAERRVHTQFSRARWITSYETLYHELQS